MRHVLEFLLIILGLSAGVGFSMTLAGPGGDWLITGPEDRNLADLAWVEEAAAPGGSTALVLTAGRWELGAGQLVFTPVIPGHAYRGEATVKTSLNQAYGRLGIVWLNAAGAQVGEAWGPLLFLGRDWAPEGLWAEAPEGATQAALATQVTPSGFFATSGASGQLSLAMPSIVASLSLWANTTAEAALYAPLAAIKYTVGLEGAPQELEGAKVVAHLVDYKRDQLAQTEVEIPLVAGSGQAPIELPGQPTGYFEVLLEATGEGLAPATTSRSLGVLPVLDFEPGPDYPIACDAGMSWSYPQENRFRTACHAAQYIGLRQLRDRMTWNDVNPEPGVFDWGRYGEWARIQQEYGFTVYQIFHSMPGWLGRPTENPTPLWNQPPKEARGVYDYTYNLVRDLGEPIRYFELWNEPDIGFFAGSVWDYTAIVKAGYLGCKAADPTFGVLLGSRCSGAEFWRKTLESGCGPYFDIFNQHSYGAPEGQLQLIEEDRELMAAVGREAPVWMTEMGFRSTPAPDGTYTASEADAVSYLLRAYTCGLMAGLEKFHYFYLCNFHEAGLSLWGLLRDDLSPKPAFIALGNLIRQTRQCKPVGYLRQDGAWLVVFERTPGDHMAVAWSSGQSVLSVPVEAGASVIDAMGNQVASLREGSAALQLGPEPVFIRGVAESLRERLTAPATTPKYQPDPTPVAEELKIWLQAETRPEKPLPAEPEIMAQKLALHCMPGQEESIAFIVHNWSDAPAQCALTVTLPEHWQLVEGGPAQFEVAANSDSTQPYRFIPTKVLQGEEYSVTAELALAGKPRDVAKVWYLPLGSDIEPAERLVLEDFEQGQPFMPNDSASLEATIRRSTTTFHSGSASLEIATVLTDSQADHWIFPTLETLTRANLGNYDALELWTYVPQGAESNQQLQVQYVEKNGSAYITPVFRMTSRPGWERALLPFKQVSWGVWSAPDENGQFDPDQVVRLMIGWGGHHGPAGQRAVFYLDDLSLVQLKSRTE